MNKFLGSNGLVFLWGKIKARLAGKVDAESGKALSANDYTDAEKAKLAGLSNYTHPTGAGNRHIPAGGAGGQVLRWSTDGTAVWGADNDTTYQAATQSADGLMTAVDKTKLDGFSTAGNYALKADIAEVYRYMGSKADYAALPATGNGVGDVWDVAEDGMNYAWTGTEWDALGAAVSVDEITDAEIDAILAS